MNRSLVLLASVLSLTYGIHNAQALVITGLEAPSGSAVDTLGGGLGRLDVYTIVANNSIANGGTGTPITAFDVSFFGTFANVQNAAFGTNGPSPLRGDVIPFGPGAVAQDTHFLPNLILPGPPIPAPTEGIITVGVPGSGLSDNLISNAVAIAAHDQAAVVAIAQIVFSSGSFSGLSGEGVISIAGNPDPIPVSFQCICPEPSTAVLAVLVLPLFFARQRFRLS